MNYYDFKISVFLLAPMYLIGTYLIVSALIQKNLDARNQMPVELQS